LPFRTAVCAKTAPIMFTEPQIVTSDDLNKRSYITFYFHGDRKREYNGKALGLRLTPNRAKTLEQRNDLLRKLRYELNKALDANLYPVVTQEDGEDLTPNPIKEASEDTSVQETKVASANTVLLDALNRKLNSPLAKFYKRNLSTIHRQFTGFLTAEELNGTINTITTLRVEEFLSLFGSSGSYYMNKRRDFGILITVTAKLTGQQNTTVKDTERRKAKAKLHKPYEKKQLKPILNYLEGRYPNMYICCLLLYSTWLRPHEEIRLLTRGHFMNDMSEIHLSGDENKGGKVRVVYIPEYVRKVIIPFIS
jgi:hypothetical protein